MTGTATMAGTREDDADLQKEVVGKAERTLPACNLRFFQTSELAIGGRSMNRTMNKTMKTVAIDRFGGLNEMKIRELPVPELDANEDLVRVEVAGVGVWDPFE